MPEDFTGRPAHRRREGAGTAPASPYDRKRNFRCGCQIAAMPILDPRSPQDIIDDIDELITATTGRKRLRRLVGANRILVSTRTLI